jgi:hypothetical protein
MLPLTLSREPASLFNGGKRNDGTDVGPKKQQLDFNLGECSGEKS